MVYPNPDCKAKEQVWHEIDDMISNNIIIHWSTFSVENGIFYTVELFNSYKNNDCNRCKLNSQIFKIAFVIDAWRRSR